MNLNGVPKDHLDGIPRDVLDGSEHDVIDFLERRLRDEAQHYAELDERVGGMVARQKQTTGEERTRIEAEVLTARATRVEAGDQVDRTRRAIAFFRGHAEE